jgi:hypothetical protein
MTTLYREGFSSRSSRTAHVVVGLTPLRGTIGENLHSVRVEAACGQDVRLSPVPLNPRHWVCAKCRRRLGWGPNRTLQEMGKL